MATVSKWTPFEVALDLTATASSITRTSATSYTVKINASWETYYNGAKTNYGMIASSGGNSVNLNTFGTIASEGSGTFTGTYSISGNSATTKTVTVAFRNFNSDNGKTATKNVSFTVNVPAWTSYTVSYNANGGSGAPGNQTKWKDQTLTLSTTKPTRTGYSFLGWATSASATSATYSVAGAYTDNTAVTLYAVWKANTYTVSYNANGGSGAPATQTKTYGVPLTLSGVKPTRTNYTFKGWGTSATTISAAYTPGGTYNSNSAITLYAVWSLSYVKPSITSYSVTRCNSEGVATDDGTYIRVKFTWKTSHAVTSVTIKWSSGAGDTGTYSVNVNGTGGTVDQIIGNGAVSTEATYTVIATVADDGDTTSSGKSVAGLNLPLDLLAGGQGIAFGKTAEIPGYADVGYKTKHRNDVEFDNAKIIYGTRPDGTKVHAFEPQNAQGNVLVGYGIYEEGVGNTHIYGADVVLYSSEANNSSIRPYFRAGDSINFDIYTTGYTANSKTDVHFTVPLTKPVVGVTSISATSLTGFIFRQNDKYTHGSASGTRVVPTTYKVSTIGSQQCVKIIATFSDTTNVINNTPIGIQWHGTLTFA